MAAFVDSSRPGKADGIIVEEQPQLEPDPSTASSYVALPQQTNVENMVTNTAVTHGSFFPHIPIQKAFENAATA